MSFNGTVRVECDRREEESGQATTLNQRFGGAIRLRTPNREVVSFRADVRAAAGGRHARLSAIAPTAPAAATAPRCVSRA